MSKKFTSAPDRFSINGDVSVNGSELSLDGHVDVNGAWHFDNDTKLFSYLGR